MHSSLHHITHTYGCGDVVETILPPSNEGDTKSLTVDATIMQPYTTYHHHCRLVIMSFAHE